MTQTHLLNIKLSELSRLESLWFLSSILLLISSMMCLAVAIIAIVLPSENMVMILFAVAGVTCGLVAYFSIKALHRRYNPRHYYINSM